MWLIEMNKAEGDKCVEMSKSKYRAGDIAGALRLASKAIKLDKNQVAEEWLIFLQSKPAPSSNKSERSTKKASEAEDKPVRPFTTAEVKGIKKILSHKTKGDLYGILEIEKECTDKDLKKQYRKMALLYHPDKCGAPGADDAFKAISHAWTVLGDSNKRSSYDRFGVDSEAPNGGGGGQSPFQAQGFEGFGGQVSPEDLLRMFMGGGGFGGGAFGGGAFGRGGFGGNGFGTFQY